jgi:hypothetical protein
MKLCCSALRRSGGMAGYCQADRPGAVWCLRNVANREETMKEHTTLDSRHRTSDGAINTKHGQTQLSTLRTIYGKSFAAGFQDSVTLGEVLPKLNETSLSQLRRDHETGHLNKKITKATKQ